MGSDDRLCQRQSDHPGDRGHRAGQGGLRTVDRGLRYLDDLPFPDRQWQPIPPEDVAELLSDAPFPWHLAGGYAIERFAGHAYRDHSDTDIGVARPDQVALQTQLAGWHLYAADPPGTLRPWRQGAYLPVGVHDIWGYRAGREAWQLQVML